MNPVIKNIIAVVAGVFVGGIINSALVNVGPSIIPLPEGADVSSMEAIRESIHLFGFANFIPPFVAHALGTLVGAFLAVKLAASHHKRIALGIGVFYLLGGITAAWMIGGPLWFNAADLILAYIPMGLLGYRLAGSPKNVSEAPNNA